MRSPYIATETQDYYITRPTGLKTTKELGGWGIAQGPDIRGWPLLNADGGNLGNIQDVMVDPHTGEGIFAVVALAETAQARARTTLIPLDKLRFDMNNRRAAYFEPMNALHAAPTYTADTTDFGPFYDNWSGDLEKKQPRIVAEPERMAGRAGGEATAEAEPQMQTVKETVTTTRVREFKKPAEQETEAQESEQAATPTVEQQQVVKKKPEEEDVPPPQV